MLSRLLLIACAGVAVAAEPAGATGGSAPWKVSFTTTVRDAERSFVELEGRTYLLIKAEEAVSALNDGQDVALIGKLRRLPGDRFGLYRADGLVLSASGDALAGKLDGDNLYLAGRLGINGGKGTLQVAKAVPAESDNQLLQTRLAGIADDDWDRRLAVVAWCREQAKSTGSDAWSATADIQLAKVIDDMGAKAGERRDVALITRAIDLTLGQLKDPVVAARVASPAWIRQHGGPQAETIGRRMRGLGFALYRDRWQPRPQALEQEFEDRFAATSWKDAEAYYRLGRWADENSEALPRGRERSWRCYQAGNRADPSHPGLARELGIQPVSAGAAPGTSGAGAALATMFIDLESGLQVPAPANWRRGQSQTDGNASWIDPDSDTATILVRALKPPVDPSAAWALIQNEARGRPGFIEVASTESQQGPLKLSTLRSTWSEGDQQHYAAVTLAYLSADKPAAILEARGLPSERERLDAALDASAAGTTVQESAAKP